MHIQHVIVRTYDDGQDHDANVYFRVRYLCECEGGGGGGGG